MPDTSDHLDFRREKEDTQTRSRIQIRRAFHASRLESKTLPRCLARSITARKSGGDRLKLRNRRKGTSRRLLLLLECCTDAYSGKDVSIPYCVNEGPSFNVGVVEGMI